MSEPLFQDRISDGPQTPEDVTKSHEEDPDEAYERRRQYDEDKIMNEKSAEDFIPGDDELEPVKSVINFNINDKRIAEAKEEFKDVDAYKDLPAAKKAKQTLTKMRTTLAEAHKEQKAEALAFGRSLDTEKRRLLELIAEIEDPIKKDLDDIKNAEALAEQERIDEIESRINNIRSYGQNLDGRDVAELQKFQELLATIVIDSSYQEFIESAQGAYYEAESRLRLAITKRQEFEEEEARLETQRKEQEKKQAELDAKQEAIDEHDRKWREAQAETNRIQKEKDDEAAAERQDELDAQAEEQRQAQKKIDDENARLAKEKSDKEEADRKEQAARDEETARLAAAPDVEKLEHWREEIIVLVTESPTIETEAGDRVVTLTCEMLVGVIDYITNETRKMK